MSPLPFSSSQPTDQDSTRRTGSPFKSTRVTFADDHRPHHVGLMSGDSHPSPATASAAASTSGFGRDQTDSTNQPQQSHNVPRADATKKSRNEKISHSILRYPQVSELPSPIAAVAEAAGKSATSSKALTNGSDGGETTPVSAAAYAAYCSSRDQQSQFGASPKPVWKNDPQSLIKSSCNFAVHVGFNECTFSN